MFDSTSRQKKSGNDPALFCFYRRSRRSPSPRRPSRRSRSLPTRMDTLGSERYTRTLRPQRTRSPLLVWRCQPPPPSRQERWSKWTSSTPLTASDVAGVAESGAALAAVAPNSSADAKSAEVKQRFILTVLWTFLAARERRARHYVPGIGLSPPLPDEPSMKRDNRRRSVQQGGPAMPGIDSTIRTKQLPPCCERPACSIASGQEFTDTKASGIALAIAWK